MLAVDGCRHAELAVTIHGSGIYRERERLSRTLDLEHKWLTGRNGIANHLAHGDPVLAGLPRNARNRVPSLKVTRLRKRPLGNGTDDGRVACDVDAAD